MSKLEANTIDTISGTSNLTIGSTNSSTVTFENGAPTGHMYPAFLAYASSSQTLSDNTTTKVQFNSEFYDTDNAYDNSTNYRFTPQVAGKYFVHSYTNANSGTNTNIKRHFQYIYKNGSQIQLFNNDMRDSYGRLLPLNTTYVVEMNGSSDYLEIFILVDTNNSGTSTLTNGSTEHSFFGAYRIGA
jgi:hypothetical protein